MRGTVCITLTAVKPTNSSTKAVKPADTCSVYDSDVEFKNKASKITYLISVSCFGEIPSYHSIIPLGSNSGMRFILICYQNFLNFSKHCLEVGNYQPEVESSSDN